MNDATPESTPEHTPARSGRRRGRSVAIGIGVVVAGLIAVVGWVAFGSDDGRPGPVTADGGGLTARAPKGWVQARTTPLPFEGVDRPYLQIAPDIEAYRESRSAPGAELLLLADLGPTDLERLLETTAARTGAPTECTTGQRQPYAEHGLEGFSQHFQECEGGGDLWLLVATTGDERLVVVGVQSATGTQRMEILASLDLDEAS